MDLKWHQNIHRAEWLLCLETQATKNKDRPIQYHNYQTAMV